MEGTIAVPDALSHDRIAELKEAFSLLDQSAAGSISTADLRVILLTLVPEYNEAEVERILHEADMDSSGAVDFAEFVSLMVEVSGVNTDRCTPSSARDMMNLFSKMDPEGTGFVSQENFAQTMRSGVDGLSETEAREVLEDAQQLHCIRKGKIHYKRFISKLIAAETRQRVH